MAASLVKVSVHGLEQARAALAGIRNGLPKALAGAVNDTTRKQVTAMSRAIRGLVNIKKRDIDPFLRRTIANVNRLTGTITLNVSARPSLKYFGARQTNSGVTYKIGRQGSRGRIPNAFGPNIPRLGGHVYVRAGKERLPIIRRRGPSPWAVFVKNDLEGPTVRETERLLTIHLSRRVRFQLLKAAGTI